MANFPKLIPAFTAQISISPPTVVGPVSSGSTLLHVSFTPEQGFLRSEPGYPVAVDAVFLHGADYIRQDAGAQHVRLEVSSLLRDKKTEGTVRFDYTGTIALGGPSGKVFAGGDDAATTEFGEAFTQVKFETGHPALKAVESKVYVGSGRFILEEGKGVVVEYKISEVAH